MNETEFKALMYWGRYVDPNRLESGIYFREKPCIYLKDETIELLIERGRNIKDGEGNCLISETYFQNLKECELVKIVIIIPN